MIPILCEKLNEITCGTLVYPENKTKTDISDRVITDLSTDSRTFTGDAGENINRCFLALKGETFDGNAFAENAAKNGAGLIICSLDKSNAEKIADGTGAPVIVTDDTLDALGKIGKYCRDSFRGKVVAVTGSVGKTSTKDITAKVLSYDKNVLKTKANFNNEIGLPTTLLGLDNSYGAAVVEMGMRGLGQIRKLAAIATPDIAVITNIGLCHIELLGSQENILRAKLEIASKMQKGGVLLLNGDDPLLSDREKTAAILTEYGAHPEVYYFGTSPMCDFRAENAVKTAENTKFDIVVKNKTRVSTTINLPGNHNVLNALAAAGVAYISGMDPEPIAKAVEAVESSDTSRQKIITRGDGTEIMDDTYNAGFESMKASLSVLKDRKDASKGGGRLVAVLGDMLELGEMSDKVHTEIGKFAAELGYDALIACGPLSRFTLSGFKANAKDGTIALWAEDSVKASEIALETVQKGDKVLVKGSHSMHMEKVSAALGGNK